MPADYASSLIHRRETMKSTRGETETQTDRIERARQSGVKAGKRGDPIWYNPHLQLMATAWQEGWESGKTKRKTKTKKNGDIFDEVTGRLMKAGKTP